VLQAHSVLRYAQWRATIAAYVAARLDLAETDVLPRTIGQVTLAISLSAYEHWLDEETQPLERLLDAALDGVVGYFRADRGPRAPWCSTVDREVAAAAATSDP
jgi:hypothetical protein